MKRPRKRKLVNLARVMKSIAHTVLLLVGLIQPTHAFTLVTDDEAMKSAQNLGGGMPMDLVVSVGSQRPSIEIKNPQLLAESLVSPFPIELIFIPADSPIMPETFRAFYGSFKINITDRILKKAKVLSGGLQVDDAEIPTGNHKILLVIEDLVGHRAERELRFTVK